jgi:anaerobic magnesium-protoporphyrin IX monomethyl ester cyclase
MARVTLIRPPLVSGRRAYGKSVQPSPGLAYVAASLEKAGHEVTLIDALGEAPLAQSNAGHPKLIAFGLPIPEIVRRIPKDTQGIGVSIMFSVEWPHVQALCEAAHAELPEVPIFAGGEHISAMWPLVLRTCSPISVCAIGEGDATAVDIADWIDGRLSLEDIPGIAYRRNGVPATTERRPRQRDIGQLPWPAWHLFPLESYFAGGYGGGVNRGRSLPLLGTRGCPYQCTFCSSPDMWGTRYYTRPVKDLVDEIEHFARMYEIENFDFADLTAFVKRGWVLELCDEIERRGLRLTFQLPSGTRSEVLDADVLERLKRIGVRNLAYAPESGSERIIEQVKKRVDCDHLFGSMREAVRQGFVTRLQLILGFPGERRSETWGTLRMGLRAAWMGVDDILMFHFTPYPGTALYEQLRREGCLPEPDTSYFASLDTTAVQARKSYCQVPGLELSLYQIVGMGACVITGLIRKPRRLVRLIRNVARGRSESSLEKNVVNLLRRRFTGRQSDSSSGPASPALQPSYARGGQADAPSMR